jgi:hypothetical protein
MDNAGCQAVAGRCPSAALSTATLIAFAMSFAMKFSMSTDD